MKKLTKWLGNNSEGIKSISHLYGNKEASIQAAVNPSFPQEIQSNPKEAHTNKPRTTVNIQANKKQNLNLKILFKKNQSEANSMKENERTETKV